MHIYIYIEHDLYINNIKNPKSCHLVPPYTLCIFMYYFLCILISYQFIYSMSPKESYKILSFYSLSEIIILIQRPESTLKYFLLFKQDYYFIEHSFIEILL
jgi:hypothetical protein